MFRYFLVCNVYKTFNDIRYFLKERNWLATTPEDYIIS